MDQSSRFPSDPLQAALGMLARRPYSVAEMRRALERKFGGGAPVRAAVARLRELGYLDDKKFAALYASSLARNRAFGSHRIRRELKAKLVDYKYIEPALGQAFEEVDEHGLLASKHLALEVSFLDDRYRHGALIAMLFDNARLLG